MHLQLIFNFFGSSINMSIASNMSLFCVCPLARSRTFSQTLSHVLSHARMCACVYTDQFVWWWRCSGSNIPTVTKHRSGTSINITADPVQNC